MDGEHTVTRTVTGTARPARTYLLQRVSSALLIPGAWAQASGRRTACCGSTVDFRSGRHWALVGSINYNRPKNVIRADSDSETPGAEL